MVWLCAQASLHSILTVTLLSTVATVWLSAQAFLHYILIIAVSPPPNIIVSSQLTLATILLVIIFVLFLLNYWVFSETRYNLFKFICVNMQHLQLFAVCS